jgi:uncharacterized protein (TIGR02271 family)
MQQTMTRDQLLQARGRPVYGSDGSRLGEIEEIFVDNDTEQPEWFALGAGFAGAKRVLVPVTGATSYEDGFQVPYREDQVKATPDVDSDEISQEFEARLYSHYGLQYSARRSQSGLPEGGMPERTPVGEALGDAESEHDVRGPGEADIIPSQREPDTTRAQGEADIVRTEEELAVGKRPVETGRARLRKWVETEPVSVDVDLQRETARVRREAIDQPVSDVELGEEDVEVPLRGEEPVVEKRAVARERITVEKDVETERETVSDEVRRERVDIEGDDDRR